MADVIPRRGNEADFTFKVGDFDTDVLKVTAFSGSEGISELFHFRVDLCSDDANIDFDAVVGKACTLEIATSAGSRFVNGIVSGFERTGEGVTLTHYAADVVPLFWLLTNRYKSRIFQEHNCEDMTIPGIVKKVFTDAGIPEDNFRLALEGSYETRDFIVQYRESDWDFVSRLMEEEGIFYFFEHTADGHKLVMGDSGVASVANPLTAEIPFRDPTGLVPEREFVFSLRDRKDIRIGAVMLDDYNFTQPALQLRASVKADEYTSLEFSDYPGEYDDKAVGDRYARIRLEEYQAAKRVVTMASVVRSQIPGFKFTLVEHPAESVNREYLVTRIDHRATQTQSGQEEALGEPGTKHETQIRTIPSDVPYRAPRATRRPVVLGSQTALVVGPSGEEIYTDEEGYGRVKVQFHWDREGEYNENSSCWIRVSQGWAGGNYGMIFLPRVGQEVIVDFLEGNPDYPIITGRVYNNDNMPPYPLPDEKTKSTIKSRSSKGGGGFNELRFDDKKDSEQVFLHAQKDLHVRVQNEYFETTGKNKHVTVKETLASSVGSEGRSVGKDQSTKVGGDYSLKVSGSGAVEVAGSHKIQADADLGLAGDKFKLAGAAEGTVKAPTLVIKGDTITLKSGGNFITIDGGGVHIVGSAVNINSGGSAANTAGLSVISAKDPAGPQEATTGDPGQDFTYTPDPAPYDQFDDAPLHDETTSEEDHWIGIRLYDVDGKPLVGERYLVVLPDGTTVARGTTNDKGEAEIKGIDPGACDITFPDLDARTWETGPAPAASSAPSGGPPSGVPSGAPTL